MTLAFFRTVGEKSIECSWYDKNGRRYRHEIIHPKDIQAWTHTDNYYGYMAYARCNIDFVLDKAPIPHPVRITDELKSFHMRQKEIDR